MLFNREMHEDNVVYTHNGVLLSHEEIEIMALLKMMLLENIVLNETSQAQNIKGQIFSHTFGS